MSVKFANKTVVVGSVTVRRGDAWAADSEMVKVRPDLFDDEPTRVATGGPRHAAEVPQERLPHQVERATRRPGEKRATPPRKRAPRKRAAKKAAASKPPATTTPPTPPADTGGGDTPPADE